MLQFQTSVMGVPAVDLFRREFDVDHLVINYSELPVLREFGDSATVFSLAVSTNMLNRERVFFR